jgi:hypothetical protein
VYSQLEVQRGLSVSRLVTFFQKVGKGWQIKPEIRSQVVVREHNLLDDGQGLGRFDVILCRNLLIYFDERLKRAVLGRLAEQLATEGYLVLGSAETISGLSPDFMPVPENCHGVFNFTPPAVAERAERIAKRRREAGAKDRPPSGDGGAGVSGRRDRAKKMRATKARRGRMRAFVRSTSTG